MYWGAPRNVKHVGQVSFYEIWDGENFIVDIGFDCPDPQVAATALAKMLSPTAEAHFDRVAELWI